MRKKCFGLLSVLVLIIISGCNKYLDIKPKDKMIPTTVDDFTLLFNNLDVMNVSPSLGNISDDNIYLTDVQYQGLFLPFTRTCYTWSKDVFVESDDVRSWSLVYKKIYYANTVLAGLTATTPGTQVQKDQLRGAAEFYKAESFFDLVRTFAKQYDASSAAQDLGIPLQDETDINVKPVRATVQQVYDRVLHYLDDAEQLLPATALLDASPTKGSALAIKARVYLQMGNYDKALENADKCLQLQSTLLNYNSYNQPAMGNIFPVNSFSNKEILYFTVGAEYIYARQCNVTAAFLDRYFPVGDMRRELFFRTLSNGTINFIGNYNDGSIDRTIPYVFTGPTTAEMLLIRAECNARKGNITNALKDVNNLRLNRIKPANYVLLTATTANEALGIVLAERTRELIFRESRWHDLQRLNKDPKLAITLSRTVNGNTYTLPPNDPRYVMPIPVTVITMSGMPQNPR